MEIPHQSTFLGLHKWYEHMYEHLGWMVLAKHYGRTMKIKTYIGSVHELKKQLIKKIKSTKNKDRKNDLTILLVNTDVLIEHIHKDF